MRTEAENSRTGDGQMGMTPASPVSGPVGSRRLWLWLAVVVTLVGAGLRFYRLTGQSLWTDEVSSIDVARAPLNQIYRQSAEVNNSLPTYFLLLRPLVEQASTDLEWRTRAVSAAAGTLSIPVFMGIVYLWRRHYGAALAAGVLLATNPLHIWYSQEVRAYALMLFFGLLTLLFFELARSQRRVGWWGLYVVSALAALALHKTALVFPVACGLWHGWEVLRRCERLRNLLVHAPIALAGLIVLMLKSYAPGEGYGRRSSPLEIAYTFMTFAGGYSFGPSLTDIQSHGPFAAVARHWVQVGILAAALLLAGVAGALNWRRLVFGREALLLALGIGVVAVYAILSGFPYNIRYTLSALFGLQALLGVYVTELRCALLARVSLTGILLVGLWADGQWFFTAAYRKGDSRAVAEWLVTNQETIKTWTVLPGYLGRSVEWYLQGHPAVLSHQCPPQEDRTTTFPPVPDVLIIGRRHHLQEPDRLVAAYEAAAGDVRTIRAFTGFELYVRESGRSRSSAGDQ